MSKGIIVMDIPAKCNGCPVRHPGLAKCLITEKSTSHTEKGRPMNERKRPSWCPIITIPDIPDEVIRFLLSLNKETK